MNQEFFRSLLTEDSKSPLSASSAPKPKAKVVDASQPAFKPRKLKKNEEKGYRDRAVERRTGAVNDYSEVEAVLEEFEKQHAGEDKAVVDSKRRYLGGDGAHSILVKGLDMALLEQNKARAAAQESRVEDEDLEKAFLERSQPSPPRPALVSESGNSKKRTREELIRELKTKRGAPLSSAPLSTGEGNEGERELEPERTKEEEARELEKAKRAGKFRPIGFKPIGSSTSEVKKKKKKVKVKSEDAKKKAETEGETKLVKDAPEPVASLSTMTIANETPSKPPLEPEPEPLTGNFDIFAGVGEYSGLDLDSDEDEVDEAAGSSRRDKVGQSNISTRLEEDEEDENRRPLSPPPPPLQAPGSRKWVDTGSPEPEPEPSNPDLLKSMLKSVSSSSTTNGKGKAIEERRAENEQAEEDGQVTSLVPLASSALPSIKDFLAMESKAGGHGKRRKRKGGGGGGGEGGKDKKRSTGAKVERDYKRLKSYTDAKEAT